MSYDTDALRALTQRIFNPNADNRSTDEFEQPVHTTFIRTLFTNND